MFELNPRDGGVRVKCHPNLLNPSRCVDLSPVPYGVRALAGSQVGQTGRISVVYVLGTWRSYRTRHTLPVAVNHCSPAQRGSTRLAQLGVWWDSHRHCSLWNNIALCPHDGPLPPQPHGPCPATMVSKSCGSATSGQLGRRTGCCSSSHHAIANDLRKAQLPSVCHRKNNLLTGVGVPKKRVAQNTTQIRHPTHIGEKSTPPPIVHHHRPSDLRPSNHHFSLSTRPFCIMHGIIRKPQSCSTSTTPWVAMWRSG